MAVVNHVQYNSAFSLLSEASIRPRHSFESLIFFFRSSLKLISNLCFFQTMRRKPLPVVGHPQDVLEPGHQEEVPKVGAQVSSRQEPQQPGG